MDRWVFLARSTLKNNDAGVTFGFLLFCARCQLFSGEVLLSPSKERVVAGTPE